MKFLLLLFVSFSTSILSQELISSAHFSSGKSKISSAEVAQLHSKLEAIDTLGENIVAIEIRAYTDHDGSLSYNKNLALKRAESVKKIIQEYPILSQLELRVKAVGEIQVDNLDEGSIDSLKAANRRVDILIIDQRFNFHLSDTLKVGDILVLDGILFHGGSHKVLKESYPVVRHIFNVLKDNPDYTFNIQGHIFCPLCETDGYNSDTDKYDLSLSRAKTIHDLFVKNGIKDENLSYEGLMGLYPLGKGDKYDRRVELKVTRIPN